MPEKKIIGVPPELADRSAATTLPPWARAVVAYYEAIIYWHRRWRRV